MNLDHYVKQLKHSPQPDSMTALLAVLPAISMLKKLMKRKQSGKKKFSDSFQYDEKVAKILQVEEEFQSQLENQKYDVFKDKTELTSLSEISLSASQEIANASLKEDYLWISRTFQHSLELLSQAK